MEDAQATSAATEAQRPAGEDAPSGPPGFGERGRMRRRARFLRKARELAYRDLGGLVFDLHRFGRRNDTLVLAKLETIGRIDGELRALEATLAERQPVTVLREAGVAACPRCAAIHGSNDRFCPNCGLAMDLRAERPFAGAAPASPAPAAAPASPSAPAHHPAPASAPVPPLVSTPAPAPSAPTPARTQTAVHPSTAAPAAPPEPASATAALTPNPPAEQLPAGAASAASTPAPSPPAGTATPAPAAPATPPAAPAPASGPAETREPRPNVDQPTEIVRPPTKDQ